jgi:hypothetical protein
MLSSHYGIFSPPANRVGTYVTYCCMFLWWFLYIFTTVWFDVLLIFFLFVVCLTTVKVLDNQCFLEAGIFSIILILFYLEYKGNLGAFHLSCTFVWNELKNKETMNKKYIFHFSWTINIISTLSQCHNFFRKNN